MNEHLYRIYRIYRCNRCLFYRIDPHERPKDWSLKWQIGWCKESGKEVPVMDDPQYDLKISAPWCTDYVRGKPRKKKPSKKEERLMKLVKENK